MNRDSFLNEMASQLKPLAVDTSLHEPLTFTGTLQTVGERLALYFESAENLRSHLEKYGGFRPPKYQLTDITVSLRQARELFALARRAEMTVLPIIAYYAMASFARALILSFENPKRLNELAPGHGLKAPTEWGVPLEDLKVQSEGEKGFLFQRFVETVRDTSWTPILIREQETIRVRCPYSGPSELSGLKVSLRQLLSRIDGLQDFYRQTFDESPKIAKAGYYATSYVGTEADAGWHGLQVDLVLDAGFHRVDQYHALHPALRCWRFARIESGGYLFTNLPPKLDPRRLTREQRLRQLVTLDQIAIPLASVGTKLCLPGALGNTCVSDLILQYLTAFLLGSIARYRPDLWAGVANLDSDSKSSRLRAIIDIFYEQVFSRFQFLIMVAMARTRITVRDGTTALDF